MLCFSHLIHLSHAFFGTPVSVRRDNWHDDISPITGTNVRQYEVLMFKHNSFNRNVTGVIELGYGSHKPELTIEFDTENCSYRANLFVRNPRDVGRRRVNPYRTRGSN